MKFKNFIKKIKNYSIEALSRHTEPQKAGFSFAMGIFIACTPFYGFQSLLIMAFAWLFKLNFPIAFLASQISLPPFYVILVPIQISVGQYVLNRPFLINDNYLQMAQENFYTWLIGSLIVGFALSSITGYFWYRVQSHFNKKNVIFEKA